MGRETAQLKLHQRCIDILDFAIRAKNRQNEAVSDLNRYHATKDPFATIKLIYRESDFTKRIERYSKIHSRIMQWYYECFDRLERVQKLSTAHALQLTNNLS